MIEIGAGGGSIADVDAIGLIKVGPASAGSDPGPAAYGLGGTAPTVTDANLVLGYLNPDFFAGGTMTIDMDAAKAALASLGEQAGLSVEALAWGIHDIVNENMAGAARVHIAERGRDPRGFSVLATGGGGPLHAYHMARKLGLKRLIVPPAAGVASAVGLLIAPASADRVATVAERLDRLDWPAFEARFQALQTDAGAVIAETGADPATATITRRADIRYVGQAFELVRRPAARPLRRSLRRVADGGVPRPPTNGPSPAGRPPARSKSSTSGSRCRPRSPPPTRKPRPRARADWTWP